jgi:hypothetical protein
MASVAFFLKFLPIASQLRPITLYKILTKMLVAHLLNVLPRVLHVTQLCSVQGRSIFNEVAAVLSAAK